MQCGISTSATWSTSLPLRLSRPSLASGAFSPLVPTMHPSTRSPFGVGVLVTGRSSPPISPLALVRLAEVMERTEGSPNVAIGLIDGPIAAGHPDLAGARIREIPGKAAGMCARATSAACQHGTFVSGILCARRGAPAPAIAPGCALLLRPIFDETSPASGTAMPSATPEVLAEAITDCVTAGARVLNLSVAVAQASTRGARQLELALDHAAHHGALVVAAAGNQATLGSSAITRHSGVIPVVACDAHGRPTDESNLGRSIGRQGLRAPGQAITSLGPEGQSPTLGGTSVAAPFVTGTIALLWSEFPDAPAVRVRAAVLQVGGSRRTLVPPLLDASAAYEIMARGTGSVT
jgi:subtilisin family serine protease